MRTNAIEGSAKLLQEEADVSHHAVLICRCFYQTGFNIVCEVRTGLWLRSESGLGFSRCSGNMFVNLSQYGVLAKIEGQLCVSGESAQPSSFTPAVYRGSRNRLLREAPPDSPFHTTPRTLLGSGYCCSVSWLSGTCVRTFLPLSQTLAVGSRD